MKKETLVFKSSVKVRNPEARALIGFRSTQVPAKKGRGAVYKRGDQKKIPSSDMRR